MASLTGTFTAANEVSTTLTLGAGESANVILTKTGGEMAIRVERRDGLAWTVLGTHTADTSGTLYANTSRETIYLRLLAFVANGTSVAYTLADVAGDAITEVKNANGTTVFEVTDTGIETPAATVSGLTQSGSLGVTSVAHIAGQQTTEDGVGTAGTGVTAVEVGNGAFHQTILTLTNVVLPLVSVTTGNGVGGVTLYTMPEGYIYTLGSVAALTWAVPAAKQADFTDATPEGQLGIGTLAPANADALGTDATDDNLSTAADITGADFAGAVNLVSEAPLAYDGSETAMPVVLTGLIDAADIDNDVTTNILVSGTVTLHWINRGDVTAIV